LALAFVTALACGGGSGGGSGGAGGPEVPVHQPSAEQATKLSGIGDSIMEGVDVVSLGFQRALSFAQGTDAAVFSLYSRYELVSGLPAGEAFASASGATMIDDAHDQAVEICAQSPLPNRVVILLGANDACSASGPADFPPVATFRNALKATLDELGACLPSGSWVHVLSIPRLDLLYQAVETKRATSIPMSCAEFFHTYVPCTIAADSPAAVGAQVIAYNDGIAAEVADAHAALAAAGVQFTTDWKGAAGGLSIGTATFGADDISSADCFHPSKQGQAKLACAAWESWEGAGDVAACF
jgi:lysophospholipase L1-like esterase